MYATCTYVRVYIRMCVCTYVLTYVYTLNFAHASLMCVYAVHTYVIFLFVHTSMHIRTCLYPGVGANYGWIKGKSVLTFEM